MANRQARARATSSASSFTNDFKEFLLLAVAVVIGASFGAVVTSFIEDIITPLLLNPALTAAGVDDIANLSANGIKYGLFLSSIINFVVIGLVVFSVIRIFERLNRAEEVDAEPTATEKLDETMQRLNETLERKL